MPSSNVDHPAIVIRGDHLTVDLGNRVIRGTPETVDPDQREGTCVQVIGNDVTIRHAKIAGYKVAILARDCKGLKVLDSDLSYNWKQHLKSTPETEDEADWMSFHHNEKDEWLHTYAGALYLRGCSDFEIKNVKITGGQCGLMMTQCDHGLVWNNDFCFLSALGIGMYRSSENRIMHNKVDWCVRGYSEGVYNRGQDSAGILVYEQSNRNVFAYNSVTHGGDGFFLWAGQSTMDTGQGGCNDNLVYGNDFSSAVTNGIEATFSRNAFVNNKVVECWHGLWGGYSYDTKIWGNAFAANGEAISIEHGQNNLIIGNTFWRDTNAIGLWAKPETDPNWGYPKNRDTKSRDYTIRDNYFGNISGAVFRFSNTSAAVLTENRVAGFGELLKEESPNPGLALRHNYLYTEKSGTKEKFGGENQVEINALAAPLPAVMQVRGLAENDAELTQEEYAKRFDVTWDPYPTGDPRRKDFEALAPQPLKSGRDPFLKRDQLRGRRTIIVDEWGPYDFKRPILIPRGAANVAGQNYWGMDAGSSVQSFEILGPPGKWRLISLSGVSAKDIKQVEGYPSSMSGVVPGIFQVPVRERMDNTIRTPSDQFEIVMEYTGQETTDSRGLATPKGHPVRFGYSRFLWLVAWDVRFYRWTESENPADPHAAPKDIAKIFAAQPILRESPLELNFDGRRLIEGLANHYATLAEGTFTVPEGDYTLELTADDGARVWIDGKLLIADAWHYQGPTSYSRNLHLNGQQHTIRVEHFQIDGYAALKVDLKPKR